jgi:hypothetical protein
MSDRPNVHAIKIAMVLVMGFPLVLFAGGGAMRAASAREAITRIG